MMNRAVKRTDQLTADQLGRELERIRCSYRFWSRLKSTFCLLTALFAAVLLAVMWLPVVQISGEDMAPALGRGDVVVTVRTGTVEQGDMVVFLAGGGKLLVKRMIAGSGDTVNILEDGTVTVNGTALSEPYAEELSVGECDVEFPCTVPEGRIFVMGDNRGLSLDSRSSKIGCVAQEQIIGRVALRIWPIDEIEMLLPAGQGLGG